LRGKLARMTNTQQSASEVGADLNALEQSLLDSVMSIARSMPEDVLNTVPDGLGNSPYTIIHHLLGSARYWIGEVVGGQPTDRMRAEEFGTRGTLADFEARALDTRERLERAFSSLPASALHAAPIDLSRGVLSWGSLPPEGRTSVWVLSHDLAHVAYHLGQLRLIQKLHGLTDPTMH
jgi:DinB superfamily